MILDLDPYLDHAIDPYLDPALDPYLDHALDHTLSTFILTPILKPLTLHPSKPISRSFTWILDLDP